LALSKVSNFSSRKTNVLDKLNLDSNCEAKAEKKIFDVRVVPNKGESHTIQCIRCLKTFHFKDALAHYFEDRVHGNGKKGTSGLDLFVDIPKPCEYLRNKKHLETLKHFANIKMIDSIFQKSKNPAKE
jgi:hypothetical protein